MTRVAVLKPDHLGDMVLATPAIRALRQHFGAEAVTLYVGSGTASLARYLFQDAELRIVNFPHLARSANVEMNMRALRAELSGFDLVICLRDDPVMQTLIGSLRTETEIVSGNHTIHDTAIHKIALLRRIPNYSRTKFFSGPQILWPKAVHQVGLSIGSGFPVNKWATSYWFELATRLAQQGIFVALIGGPGEVAELELLSSALRNHAHRIVKGGDGFDNFVADIDPLDVIVASDGGTAHLCSLRKPIVSVFGASPWRRYAPFGWSNLVITRDVPCSPCVQFSTDAVNGCLTRECLARLTPKLVHRAVMSAGVDFSGVRGAWVQKATSHTFEG